MAKSPAPEASQTTESPAPAIVRDESKLNEVRSDDAGRKFVKYIDPDTGEEKEREVIEPTEAEMAAARGGNVTHVYADGSSVVGCPPFPAESPLERHKRQLREQAEREDPSLIGLAERQQRTPEQMGITTAERTNQRAG